MRLLDSVVVTKDKNVFSSEERLEEILSHFNGFTNSGFRRKVCELVIRRGGHVKMGRYILENKLWDGSLELHFADPPTALDVVKVIREAHADDFGMGDDKTLWFWWD